jgi:hypothetical protein
MEVSGESYATAALPHQRASGIRLKGCCVCPRAVWKFWKEKSLTPAGFETSDRPARGH